MTEAPAAQPCGSCGGLPGGASEVTWKLDVGCPTRYQPEFELSNWVGKDSRAHPCRSFWQCRDDAAENQTPGTSDRESRVRGKRSLGLRNACLGATETFSSGYRPETRDKPGEPDLVSLSEDRRGRNSLAKNGL